MLELKNISKCFNTNKAQIKALDKVNFKVGRDEIIGIIGPNGAGKSTLLRIIAGLIKPTDGEIIVNNNNFIYPDGMKKNVGYVAVETGLYENMSPYELLYYFGRVYDLTDSQIQGRINELSELLGINDYLHRRIEGFSTGMKQKVSIARGLLHKPKLLILDEPTNGLDIISAHYIRKLIIELKLKQTSVIISTHIITDIELCDRLIVVNEGKVVYQNRTSQVINNYNSLEDLFFEVVTPSKMKGV